MQPPNVATGQKLQEEGLKRSRSFKNVREAYNICLTTCQGPGVKVVLLRIAVSLRHPCMSSSTQQAHMLFTETFTDLLQEKSRDDNMYDLRSSAVSRFRLVLSFCIANPAAHSNSCGTWDLEDREISQSARTSASRCRCQELKGSNVRFTG